MSAPLPTKLVVPAFIAAVFKPGFVSFTPDAAKALTPPEFIPALISHIGGNWGDIEPAAWRANDRALGNQGNLMARYYRRDGLPSRIFTNLKAGKTMILLETELQKVGYNDLN